MPNDELKNMTKDQLKQQREDLAAKMAELDEELKRLEQEEFREGYEELKARWGDRIGAFLEDVLRRLVKDKEVDPTSKGKAEVLQAIRSRTGHG